MVYSQKVKCIHSSVDFKFSERLHLICRKYAIHRFHSNWTSLPLKSMLKLLSQKHNQKDIKEISIILWSCMVTYFVPSTTWFFLGLLVFVNPFQDQRIDMIRWLPLMATMALGLSPGPWLEGPSPGRVNYYYNRWIWLTVGVDWISS